MASVVISGDTSGTATLQAQAIAGNTTLTLPTTSGNVALQSGDLGTPSAIVLTNATGTANSLNAGIGVNQTWQNVTASRALGTTYTNSTGKPICATVAVSSSTAGVSSLQKIINGVTIASDNEYGPNSGYVTGLDLIIPNGATYSFTASNASLSTWFELR